MEPILTAKVMHKKDTQSLYRYRFFGLNVQSGIPLLLPTADPVQSSADVVIQYGEIPKDGIAESQEIGGFCQARPGTLWLHVPDVAWFLVSDGRQIDVMPEPECDQQTLLVYLLDSVMSALLHQRGLLVLRGSAIRVGQRAIVICGASGVGKSTVGAVLIEQGFQLLSDNLCVIDQDGQIQPGYPEIKLWQDTIEALNISRTRLTPVRKQIKKYARPLQTEEFHDKPLPLVAVYILSTDNLHAGQLHPLKGMKAYLPVKNQTYQSRYLIGLGMAAHHLQLCGRLLKGIPVAQLYRSLARMQTDSPTALVNAILADLAAKGLHADIKSIQTRNV